MRLLKKIREVSQSKKGFTLVEKIIVIVILTILAAVLVPSLMQYIDRVENQRIITNARRACLAIQTLASEEYAQLSPASKNITADKVLALAGVTEGEISFALNDTYQVTSFYYKDKASGKVTSYDGSLWSEPSVSTNFPIY